MAHDPLIDLIEQYAAPMSDDRLRAAPDDFDPHPFYGPCDGFKDGSCSVCRDLLYHALTDIESFRAALAGLAEDGERYRKALDECVRVTREAVKRGESYSYRSASAYTPNGHATVTSVRGDLCDVRNEVERIAFAASPTPERTDTNG